MQKFAYFCLLLSFFGYLSSQAVMGQAPAGTVIMGYTLGIHGDSIPMTNLLKMGKFQKLIRWDRQDEPLRLEGIDLVHVRLYFWDSHLHSIEIKTADAQGDKMFAWLKSVYGEGRKLDAMGYRYEWFLPTMRIIWDQNMAVHQGVAEFIDEVTNDKYYKFMYAKENRQ